MKYFLVAWLLFLLAVCNCDAAKPRWEDNYRKALARANSESKYVLVNFTSSDNCLPCMKMYQNIFSKPQFKDFARKNLVLMEVDFPRTKRLPFNQEMQNQRLAKEFGVVWFPAIFLLSPEGKRLMRFRYMEGGPERFIAAIQKSMP